MAIIELTTRIHAPIERCFDLARCIDVHTVSTSATGEQAVAGVTTGLIGMGEQVTWRARHLGVRQHLTSSITAFDRPRHFRDSMVRGAFKRIDHDHFFRAEGEYTTMIDRFDFNAPLGLLGRIAERIFLTAYMRRFLKIRNGMIRDIAESDGWKRFL